MFKPGDRVRVIVPFANAEIGTEGVVMEGSRVEGWTRVVFESPDVPNGGYRTSLRINTGIGSMVVFQPGDLVRVTDKWWSQNVRPGEWVGASRTTRDFVIKAHNVERYPEHGGLVVLERSTLEWYAECFEHVSGPW